MSAYDIVRILPFDDPIVLIEVSGQALWDALESSLSLYPALEGFVTFVTKQFSPIV